MDINVFTKIKELAASFRTPDSVIRSRLDAAGVYMKNGCNLAGGRLSGGCRGLLEVFFPKAVGLAIRGDDLLVTRVCKRSFSTVSETVRVADFFSEGASKVELDVDIFKRSFSEVVLSMPRDRVLVRDVELPGLGLNELKDALRYQLDSFVPFTEDDVYYDVYSVSSDNDDGLNDKMLIVAIRKDHLDEVVSRLGAFGVVPTRVIVAPMSFVPIVGDKDGNLATVHGLGNQYCYNTFRNRSLTATMLINDKHAVYDKIRHDMPDEIFEDHGLGISGECSGTAEDSIDAPAHEKQDRDTALSKSIQVSELGDDRESFGAALFGIQDEGRKFSLLNAGKRAIPIQKIMMFTFLVMLFASMIIIPNAVISRKQNALDMINTKMAVLKDDISRVEEVRSRLMVMEETLASVGKVRGGYAPRIKVLRELSEKLPKDAWIKELYIYRDIFEIGGAARTATDLIPILDESDIFSGVGLTAPVVNTAEGEESFRIKGEIIIDNMGGADESAAAAAAGVL